MNDDYLDGEASEGQLEDVFSSSGQEILNAVDLLRDCGFRIDSDLYQAYLMENSRQIAEDSYRDGI